jgi:signal transduction histidine kinase
MPETRLARDLRSISESGIALTSELSLQAVLQKVVDIAREQAEARYAAMSVLGPDGEIRQFLSSGVSAEEREGIGEIPRGHGLLGVLLRENQTLRTANIREDTRSVGFPPNHPVMTSLLGVPVIFKDRIIGNLYLTDKQDGHEFDDRDEEVVRLLAAQAAVAIHNAELYEAATRSAEEWKALFELGRDVTASPDIKQLLQSTVSRARKLLNTDMAAVMLLSTDRSYLRMAAYDGLETDAMQRLKISADHGLQGLTLELMAAVIVEDYYRDHRLKNRPAEVVAGERLVSQVCVPLIGKSYALGTLTVGNRQKTRFTERDAELVEAFGNWMAVAIEASQLYEKLESLARLEERDRIGMDLHDGVIQSIYAVGLGLEDVLYRLESEPAEQMRAAIEKAMDDLTRVIKDIRSYIFDLRPAGSEATDLRHALRQLVDDVRVNNLIDAKFECKGDMLDLLDDQQAITLFHIAQEALNNVIKHSGATSAALRLTQTGPRFVLEVRDAGTGFEVQDGGPKEKHGLRNMRDRARSVGGDLTIESKPGHGTTVRVEVFANDRMVDSD